MASYEKKAFYSPVRFYSVMKREPTGTPRPRGELYKPVIFNDDITPYLQGDKVIGFDACMNPCQDLNKAIYLVQPAELRAPEGFSDFWGPKQLPVSYFSSLYSPCRYQPAPEHQVVNAEPQSETRISAGKAVPAVAEGGDQEPDRCSITRNKEGYQLCSSRLKQQMQATNFCVDILQVNHIWDADGSDQERMELRLGVHVYGNRPVNKEFTINYEQLGNMLTEVTRRVGEAIIYTSAQVKFKASFSEFIRGELANAPHHYIMTSCGWNRLPGNQLVYVHDGAVPPSQSIAYHCGFSIGTKESMPPEELRIQNVWRLLELADRPEKILIPVLYAHLGLMWSLFEQAGYPPRTLLFIEGTTGSLKTAVASLIFNFSGLPEHNVPATFRDTSASMEVKMKLYRDRVLLVDDFCPASSGAMQKQMETSLEQLVRFYGDNIGKSRTNPQLKETYEIKPHGLCVITGEDSTGSYSSLLRCLFLSVDRNTYDKKLLAEFQNDPTLWTSYLAGFVAFCQKHTDCFKHDIWKRFPMLRDRAEALGIHERRLVDTYASLMLAAEFLTRYHQTVSCTSPEEAPVKLEEMERLIAEVCRFSQDKATEADPVKIFARILLDAIRRRAVQIGSIVEAEADRAAYIGVLHEDFWYLWPDCAYQLVLQKYRSMGKIFPKSQRALWMALVNAGVLIPAKEASKGPNNITFGTKVSFLGRPRLLKIDPTRLRQFDEEEVF